jgi:hypothetical protein
MAHNGFRIIEARRKQDERQRVIEASIAQERRAVGIANFENSTAQKIEMRNMKVVPQFITFYVNILIVSAIRSGWRLRGELRILSSMNAGNVSLTFTTTRWRCGKMKYWLV